MAAMEPAASVESSATVEAPSTSHRDASVETANRAADDSSRPSKGWPAVESRPSENVGAIVKAGVIPVHAAPAVVPRAGADEGSASKPVRTIEPVRRARVRIISVVAVRADRRHSHSNHGRRRANCDANRHSLCLRVVRRYKQQNSEHRKNLEISHVCPPESHPIRLVLIAFEPATLLSSYAKAQPMPNGVGGTE